MKFEIEEALTKKVHSKDRIWLCKYDYYITIEGKMH